MQFPVTIGLRRSSFLRAVSLATHVLAGAIAWLPDWPREAALLLSLGLLWSFVRGRRAAVPSALRLHGDGRLFVQAAPEGEFEEAVIAAGTLVHPWLTAFDATCGKRRWRVLVAPDSAAGEDRRRLRVWLRWRPQYSTGDRG